MKYKKPEMEIIIFSENDIATNLEVSNTGSDGSVDFDKDFSS